MFAGGPSPRLNTVKDGQDDLSTGARRRGGEPRSKEWCGQPRSGNSVRMIAGWRGWTAGLGRSGKRGDGPPRAGNGHGSEKQDTLVSSLVRRRHHASIRHHNAALIASASPLRRARDGHHAGRISRVGPGCCLHCHGARASCRARWMMGRFVVPEPPGRQELNAAVMMPIKASTRGLAGEGARPPLR